MAKKPAPAWRGGGSSAGSSGTLSAACRVVVLHGPEAFLRGQHTTILRAAIEKEYGEIDAQVFDGTTSQAADVLDECRSFGLIAAHKFIVVDQAEALVREETRPLFERYAQSPSDGATLVLRSGKWRPGNLDKMVAAVGAVVECKELSTDECAAWTVRRCAAEHRARIGSEAAQMLVLRVGNDLGRLDMELGKLAAAACGGGEGVHEITPAIVAVMVGMSREEEAWGVQGSLLSGNTEGTIAHLRQVLEVSRQPAQLVMWSVTDLARKLHAVCCGQHQGRNIESMAGPLKLWGPGKFAIDNAARRLKPRQTMEFFRACVKADQRSKSGFTEPDRALEVLTVRLHRAMGAR